MYKLQVELCSWNSPVSDDSATYESQSGFECSRASHVRETPSGILQIYSSIDPIVSESKWIAALRHYKLIEQ